MRQHFPRRLTIADEIVVDEVETRRPALLRQDKIQLADQLPRRFHPGLAPVQVGYIAKFALVRAPGRELQCAEQVFVEPDQVIRGKWKIAQCQALRSGIAYLLEGRFDR